MKRIVTHINIFIAYYHMPWIRVGMGYQRRCAWLSWPTTQTLHWVCA